MIIRWAVLFFLLSLTPVHAIEGCYLRLNPEPQEVELSQTDRAYLEALPETFSPHYKSYVKDAISFYIPRMQFAQARFEDMIYTLDYIERVFPEKNTEDLRFGIVLQFSSIQEWTFVAAREKFLHFNEFGHFLIENIEKAEDLIRYHVRGYNFVTWYGLCQNGTPYAFYQFVQGELNTRAKYGQLEPDLSFRETGIRVLSVRNQRVGRFYALDNGRWKVRALIPVCDPNAGEAHYVDLIYDDETSQWTETSFNLALGMWYAHGFSDFKVQDAKRGGHFDIMMTDEVQDEIKFDNEKRFILSAERAGVSIAIPNIEIVTCNEE